MTRRDVQLRIQARADLLLRKAAPDATRRKVFVSYHANDGIEVEQFIDDFGEVFIPRVIGVSEDDDFIDSEDTDYILGQIRKKYLADSTVTLVLVGRCTWARKFVDWEVYSSLRNNPVDRRNGLLAITLPSAASFSGKRLPNRVNDNISGDDGTSGYARWKKYPQSKASLRSWINDAFDARTSRAHLVDNTRARKVSNSPCP
jgi:hypothetical protein